MSLAFAIAIYFICWWIVFFVVLPFGVRTQDDVGEVAPGSVESAPHTPNLLPKILITTVVATGLFSVIYLVMAYGLLTLDDIPFLPNYEPF